MKEPCVLGSRQGVGLRVEGLGFGVYPHARRSPCTRRTPAGRQGLTQNAPNPNRTLLGLGFKGLGLGA